MRNTVAPPSQPRGRRRRRSLTSGAATCLAALEREFASFRRTHRPQTRIPGELRGAALAALKEGVTPSDLRRRCGLSLEQLQHWQGERGKGASAKRVGAPEARVFSVVDDPPPSAVELSCHDGGRRLELRLDGWVVSIRRTEP